MFPNNSPPPNVMTLEEHEWFSRTHPEVKDYSFIDVHCPKCRKQILISVDQHGMWYYPFPHEDTLIIHKTRGMPCTFKYGEVLG